MPDSSAYFSNVAEEWDDLRSGYFTEPMRDAAIARAGLAPDAVVADVGAGTGFVARGLASYAARVYGFDASREMLTVAQRNLGDCANVRLSQAGGDRLPLPDGALDAAFANMYLHHAPDPGAAIGELARVLKPGGVLCLTDLDAHDHEWQREQMADLWLGFDREDIRRWYAAAGLSLEYLDGAEGTCSAAAPDGTVEPLSIFVAIGRMPG